MVRKRAEARAERQAKIVAAARTMIKENDVENGEFSMRRLATHANVSVTTVYNIFGSKQGLMISVLNEDHNAYREWFSRVRFSDPLERSEEHTYELHSIMRTSTAVFCLTKK